MLKKTILSFHAGANSGTQVKWKPLRATGLEPRKYSCKVIKRRNFLKKKFHPLDCNGDLPAFVTFWD